MESVMLKNTRTALLTTGKGPIAKSVYSYLLKNSDLKMVIISKKPPSRSKSMACALKDYGFWYCLQAAINLAAIKLFQYKISDNKSIETIDITSGKIFDFVTKKLREKKIEKVFVCGFHYIIKQAILSQWPTTYNFHPSFLPLYRGPEPIIWGLAEKRNEFGITLHIIDDGVDTGPIVAQSTVIISKPLLAFLVELRLSKKIPYLFKQLDLCNQIIQQDEKKSSYRPFATIKNRKFYAASLSNNQLKL